MNNQKGNVVLIMADYLGFRNDGKRTKLEIPPFLKGVSPGDAREVSNTIGFA